MTDKERFTVSGSNLVEKVKELVRQGNIRRVSPGLTCWID